MKYFFQGLAKATTVRFNYPILDTVVNREPKKVEENIGNKVNDQEEEDDVSKSTYMMTSEGPLSQAELDPGLKSVQTPKYFPHFPVPEDPSPNESSDGLMDQDNHHLQMLPSNRLYSFAPHHMTEPDDFYKGTTPISVNKNKTIHKAATTHLQLVTKIASTTQKQNKNAKVTLTPTTLDKILTDPTKFKFQKISSTLLEETTKPYTEATPPVIKLKYKTLPPPSNTRREDELPKTSPLDTTTTQKQNKNAKVTLTPTTLDKILTDPTKFKFQKISSTLLEETTKPYTEATPPVIKLKYKTLPPPSNTRREDELSKTSPLDTTTKRYSFKLLGEKPLKKFAYSFKGPPSTFQSSIQPKVPKLNYRLASQKPNYSKPWKRPSKNPTFLPRTTSSAFKTKSTPSPPLNLGGSTTPVVKSLRPRKFLEPLNLDGYFEVFPTSTTPKPYVNSTVKLEDIKTLAANKQFSISPATMPTFSSETYGTAFNAFPSIQNVNYSPFVTSIGNSRRKYSYRTTTPTTSSTIIDGVEITTEKERRRRPYNDGKRQKKFWVHKSTTHGLQFKPYNTKSPFNDEDNKMESKSFHEEETTKELAYGLNNIPTTPTTFEEQIKTSTEVPRNILQKLTYNLYARPTSPTFPSEREIRSTSKRPQFAEKPHHHSPADATLKKFTYKLRPITDTYHKDKDIYRLNSKWPNRPYNIPAALGKLPHQSNKNDITTPRTEMDTSMQPVEEPKGSTLKQFTYKLKSTPFAPASYEGRTTKYGDKSPTGDFTGGLGNIKEIFGGHKNRSLSDKIPFDRPIKIGYKLLNEAPSSKRYNKLGEVQPDGKKYTFRVISETSDVPPLFYGETLKDSFFDHELHKKKPSHEISEGDHHFGQKDHHHNVRQSSLLQNNQSLLIHWHQNSHSNREQADKNILTRQDVADDSLEDFTYLDSNSKESILSRDGTREILGTEPHHYGKVEEGRKLNEHIVINLQIEESEERHDPNHDVEVFPIKNRPLGPYEKPPHGTIPIKEYEGPELERLKFKQPTPPSLSNLELVASNDDGDFFTSIGPKSVTPAQHDTKKSSTRNSKEQELVQYISHLPLVPPKPKTFRLPGLRPNKHYRPPLIASRPSYGRPKPKPDYHIARPKDITVPPVTSESFDEVSDHGESFVKKHKTGNQAQYGFRTSNSYTFFNYPVNNLANADPTPLPRPDIEPKTVGESPPPEVPPKLPSGSGTDRSTSSPTSELKLNKQENTLLDSGKKLVYYYKPKKVSKIYYKPQQIKRPKIFTRPTTSATTILPEIIAYENSTTFNEYSFNVSETETPYTSTTTAHDVTTPQRNTLPASQGSSPPAQPSPRPQETTIEKAPNYVKDEVSTTIGPQYPQFNIPPWRKRPTPRVSFGHFAPVGNVLWPSFKKQFTKYNQGKKKQRPKATKLNGKVFKNDTEIPKENLKIKDNFEVLVQPSLVFQDRPIDHPTQSNSRPLGNDLFRGNAITRAPVHFTSPVTSPPGDAKSEAINIKLKPKGTESPKTLPELLVDRLPEFIKKFAVSTFPSTVVESSNNVEGVGGNIFYSPKYKRFQEVTTNSIEESTLPSTAQLQNQSTPKFWNFSDP